MRADDPAPRVQAAIMFAKLSMLALLAAGASAAQEPIQGVLPALSESCARSRNRPSGTAQPWPPVYVQGAPAALLVCVLPQFGPVVVCP